jgi:hypothetical protein
VQPPLPTNRLRNSSISLKGGTPSVLFGRKNVKGAVKWLNASGAFGGRCRTRGVKFGPKLAGLRPKNGLKRAQKLLGVFSAKPISLAPGPLRVDLNLFAVLFSEKDFKSNFRLSGNFVPVGQFFSGQPLVFCK